jgi:hypothetical protein
MTLLASVLSKIGIKYLFDLVFKNLQFIFNRLIIAVIVSSIIFGLLSYYVVWLQKDPISVALIFHGLHLQENEVTNELGVALLQNS